MTIADVLAKLEPVQRRAVERVYSDGRPYAEAARVMRVERAIIAASLVVAVMRIARWLRDDRPGGDPPADGDGPDSSIR